MFCSVENYHDNDTTRYVANIAIFNTMRYIVPTLIKMPLDMEVGLGPGDFVLDVDPAPLPKRGLFRNFWPISIVAKWLDASRCQFV